MLLLNRSDKLKAECSQCQKLYPEDEIRKNGGMCDHCLNISINGDLNMEHANDIKKEVDYD